eukprot:165521-Pelagomonas_calceolata.AAC.3
MHGGLSPELKSLEQIKRIARPTDVPDSGLLCDLLWADPEKEIQGWGENDRGVSYTFGPDCVTEFLQKHDLDLVCRAHQVRKFTAGRTLRMLAADEGAAENVKARYLPPPPYSQVVEEGYEFFAKRQLVTIFSAPNYCGEFDNAGAMMSVDDTLMCSFQCEYCNCLQCWKSTQAAAVLIQPSTQSRYAATARNAGNACKRLQCQCCPSRKHALLQLHASNCSANAAHQQARSAATARKAATSRNAATWHVQAAVSKNECNAMTGKKGKGR